MCWDRVETVHSRRSAPFSSWNQEKLLPKMSWETDSTDGCSSNAGPSLCILLTVVAPVVTITKATGPWASSLLHMPSESTLRRQIYITALQSQMYSNRSFFEGCYSNNSRWEREPVKPPSAGEHGSVCSCLHTGVWAPAGGIYHSNIVLCCNVSLCHQKIICRPLSRC